MAKCYQCNHKGYFVGEVDDCGGFLPSGAIYEAPEIIEGYVPRWTGVAWEQVENYKGKEGYVDGVATTIKEYGPLPEGWSDAPPPPTTEEKAAQVRAERDALIAATDYLMMPDYPISDAVRDEVRVYRQALRDVTEQGWVPGCADVAGEADVECMSCPNCGHRMYFIETHGKRVRRGCEHTR